MKKFILILCCIFLFSCSSKEPTREKYSEYSSTSGFDTIITLIGYETNEAMFNENFSDVKELFIEYHELYDIYNNYDNLENIKTINDYAGINPVSVNQEIIDLLILSYEYYELSDGELDITQGAILKLWKEYINNGTLINIDGHIEGAILPSKLEVEEALACSGFEYVEINDDDDNTVYISNPCVSLDVGAIAKGYATERVASMLLMNDEHADYIINAGGNTKVLGEKTEGIPWVAGLQKPDGNLNESLLNINISNDMSFVTSGDYQRYFIAEDGERYHHLIDFDTGFPANYYRSVSIVTKDSAVADAFSTILFNLNFEDSQILIKNYNEHNPENELGVIWVFDQTEGAFENMVDKDGFTIVWTENLNENINVSN